MSDPLAGVDPAADKNAALMVAIVEFADAEAKRLGFGVDEREPAEIVAFIAGLCNLIVEMLGGAAACHRQLAESGDKAGEQIKEGIALIHQAHLKAGIRDLAAILGRPGTLQ